MPELEKVVSSSDFGDWFSLNDTIMGGSSKAVCRASSKGLSLEGVVVEEKGGFVSCKSPIFSPVLNLSNYQGFELKIELFSFSQKVLDFMEFIVFSKKWNFSEIDDFYEKVRFS